jgi:hypothetical protein
MDLARPRHRAALDEIHKPIGERLGVDPEVAVRAQRLQQGVGRAAHPDLQARAVGDALGDEASDPMVTIRDLVHALTIDWGWQEVPDQALECVKRFTAAFRSVRPGA